jgi:hypothetical protein
MTVRNRRGARGAQRASEGPPNSAMDPTSRRGAPTARLDGSRLIARRWAGERQEEGRRRGGLTMPLPFPTHLGRAKRFELTPDTMTQSI